MLELQLCIDAELVRQAEKLVELLRSRHLTVVTAESCTGGLIASALSHARAASDCLHGGFVVYTKEKAKLPRWVSREICWNAQAASARM